MKLSFLVTVHNEDTDLAVLLDQLVEYKSSNTEDEIVVLDDYSDNPKTLELFEKYKDDIKLVQHALNKDFGTHKQFGNEQCNGDFIFQLDADEYLSDDLLSNLKNILSENPDVDLYAVPRINIIRGLTTKLADKYGWDVSVLDGYNTTSEYHDDDPVYVFLKQHKLINNERRISETQMEVDHKHVIINWKSGDYQSRFYKNVDHIKWDRPLHETIVGAKVGTNFPKEPVYAIIHDKTMERQEKQTEFYMTQFSREMNFRS